MSLSGPQVHQQLIGAYNEAAAVLERMRSHLTQYDSDRFLLEGERDQSLSQLAKHYLPALSTDVIERTFAEIRPTIRDVLLRKQDKARRLQNDLEADNTIRVGLEQQLLQLNERSAAALEQQQSLAEQAEQQLQNDADFSKLSDSAAMAQAALERAEANLDEISQDAARKLPAYDSCKMFTYLHEQKYGTAAYTKRGFTKRMDRMVASMCNYDQAKRDYQFLKETPETMRRIISEDRSALDLVLDELKRMRDQAADAVGLTRQIKVVADLQGERSSLLGQLADTAKRCEASQAALNGLESSDCSFYKEAVELVRGWLSRTDVDQLRRQAQLTPEISDDQIVATLRGIDVKLDQANLSAARHSESLNNAQSIHEAVGRLIQRFRTAGFDVGRCQFADSLDVIGELSRARDARDVDMVWETLRRAQSWGPTAMEQVTAVATHPMTQVLINAMAHAAAGALTEHARRAGRRR